MKRPVNFTAISKKYGPGYIARIEGKTKVLAAGKKVDILMKKIKNIKEFKENKVVISWVPKYGQKYAFRISVRIH
ncbi:hypothetical protein HYW54_03155 [Candidatus Gottesmanbacteria bacterium]|nr:hypothetical protein [Candidatus Gottesmanbacteria bacterium]